MNDCTLAVKPDAATICTRSLESVFTRSNSEEMCDALQTAIQLASNGQSIDHLVIAVIKHASTSTDHRLKKLLHIFWTLVDCYHGGQLKSHVILMSNSILYDLKSPNEMVLCSALRCILNLQVIEIISNLVVGIPPLLSHPDVRVRCAAVTAVHSVRARYGDIISLADVYTRLAEEDHPAVLRRLIFLLADLDPANGALHTLKLIKRVGIDAVSGFMYDALPQLVKGAHNDETGFFRTVYAITKQHLRQFGAHVQYAAGLGLWAVVSIYPATTLQGITGNSDSGEQPITCEDIAILAVQALLHACKTIGDDCINVVLIILREAVSTFTRAFVASGVIGNIVFSLCSSHMSDAARERLINLKLFSTLAQISPARQLVETLVMSPFVTTTCLTVLSGTISEIYAIVTNMKSSRELSDFIASATVLSEMVQRVANYLPSFTTLVKSDTEYKKSVWTDMCCDTAKLLLHILKTIATPDPSPSTIGLGQLCVKLLLQLALGSKGSNNRWSPEVSRECILAIGEISPMLALFVLCYLLKVEPIGQSTSLDSESVAPDFSREYLGISLLHLLPAVVADTSKSPASGAMLCALVQKDSYDIQDISIITASCKYLLPGLSACARAKLCKRDELAGVLVVKLARFYRSIEHSTSTCKSDLSLINGYMKQIIEFCKSNTDTDTDAETYLQKVLGKAGTTDTCKHANLVTLGSNMAKTPVANVHFSIFDDVAGTVERSVITPQTVILFGAKNATASSLNSVFLGLNLSSDQYGGEQSVEHIFDQDTNFATYSPLSSATRNDKDNQACSTGALERVVQLSGDSERIYSEAIVRISSSMIILDVLFVNRSNESAQDVVLELFSTPFLRIPRFANKVVNLEPYGSAREKYIVYVDSCETGVIYGNICAKFTQMKQRNEPRMHEIIHRIKEIDIAIRFFLSPCPLNNREFCRLWAAYAWESKIPISTQASPEYVVQAIKSEMNAFILHEEEALVLGLKSASITFSSSTGADIDEKSTEMPGTYCCNFSTKSKSGIILLNLSVSVLRGDNPTLTAGTVRIRSQTKGLSQTASSYLSLNILH